MQNNNDIGESDTPRSRRRLLYEQLLQVKLDQEKLLKRMLQDEEEQERQLQQGATMTNAFKIKQNQTIEIPDDEVFDQGGDSNEPRSPTPQSGMLLGPSMESEQQASQQRPAVDHANSILSPLGLPVPPGTRQRQKPPAPRVAPEGHFGPPYFREFPHPGPGTSSTTGATAMQTQQPPPYQKEENIIELEDSRPPHDDFPSVVRTKKGDYIELRCFICGGNHSRKHANGTFISGLQGFQRHLSSAHGRGHTFAEVVRLCKHRILSKDEVGAMITKKPGAYQIEQIVVAPAEPGTSVKKPRQRILAKTQTSTAPEKPAKRKRVPKPRTKSRAESFLTDDSENNDEDEYEDGEGDQDHAAADEDEDDQYRNKSRKRPVGPMGPLDGSGQVATKKI